jgi:uncharacterized membrane protein
MNRNRSSARHAYLDWARGLAVLIMIEAHVLDAWTRDADRSRPAFGHAMVLGGFGAPLFLFLAGVAVVLSAESKYRRSGDLGRAWWAAQKRGWEILGLAFLFRLQSFVLGGASNSAGLLKVDILNVMGPGIAMAAIVGRVTKGKASRAVAFALVALTIAAITPIVRTTALLAWLPDPVEWYLRPSPGRTNFTLFPWAGFVFAGAVVGIAIDGLAASPRQVALQVGLALAGSSIGALAYAASFLPTPYQRSDFWTSSPAFFFLRGGLLTLLIPVAYLWERAPWRGTVARWSPVEELGRASLFVYWIHVEMVYGFFSRPMRRALSLEQAFGAYVLFTLFLLGVVILKNRIVERRAIRAPEPSGSTTALSN